MRRLLIAFLTVAACGAPAAASASAAPLRDWAAPEAVSPAESSAYAPALAANDDGDASMAWVHRGPGYGSTIQTRRRTAGGAWGPLAEVSEPIPDPHGQYDDGNSHHRPSVTVDAAGNTLVVWTTTIRPTPGRVATAYYSAYAPAGKPFGMPQIVGRDLGGYGGSYRAWAFFQPSGEAVVAWGGNDRRLHSVIRRTDGTFGPEQVTVPEADSMGSWRHSLEIEAGRDGTLVATWMDNGRVASVRRPGKEFSSPQLLDVGAWPLASYVNDHVGIASDGSALIVRWEYDGHRPWKSSYVTLDANGTTFSPRRPLDDIEADPMLPLGIAFDTADHGYIVGMTGYGANSDERILAVRPATTGGTIGEPVAVSERTLGGADDIKAAYDAAGNLTLGWTSTRSTIKDQQRAEVILLFKPAGEPFGSALVHSIPRLIDAPTLVAAGQGHALFQFSDNGDIRISELTRPTGAAPTPAVAPSAGSTPPSPTPTPASPPVAPTPVVAPSVNAPAPTPVTAPAPAEPMSGPAPGRPASAPAPRTRRTTFDTKRSRRCVVPDVRGDTLAKAKRRVKEAGCTVGRVRYVRGTQGRRIARQSTPGKVKQVGWPVALVVSRPGRG